MTYKTPLGYGWVLILLLSLITISHDLIKLDCKFINMHITYKFDVASVLSSLQPE